MPITTSYGMSYGWTKIQLPQADFPLFPVVSFVKFTRRIPMRKPLAFQKAASLLPSGSTGGMLILFQLDHRHPEFPAQVSGAYGNYSTGQLESLAKDFRNKLRWRIALLLQFHRLGTLPVSFYFPPALFFQIYN